MQPSLPRVKTGAIVALRLYDLAYSIDLSEVEAIWAAHAAVASSRSRLNAAPPKALTFDVPPVALTLGPVNLTIHGARIVAAAAARIYDFGVVALELQIPVAALSWQEFGGLLNGVDEVIGPHAAAEVWTGQLSRVRDLLKPAFLRPSGSTMQEDYLLGIVREWSEPVSTADLGDRIDLVPLLSGEHRALSESARRELLRQRFSYFADDLVVLTWDRAFIYEPHGDSDVADVIEVANAQLLELRYYDELLDDELPRMYDLVEAAQRARDLLAPRRFAHLARRLYTLVAEVTELTEKVDNALQVTEDVYLARVYSAALETLRVRNVAAAVDRKLAIIRDTYSALYDEATGSRADLLEIAIVLLIVLEILLALIRH